MQMNEVDPIQTLAQNGSKSYMQDLKVQNAQEQTGSKTSMTLDLMNS
jgi:hypothetical protein